MTTTTTRARRPDRSGAPRPARRRPPGRHATDPLPLVLAGLASLPIVVAVVVALSQGWHPVGDNATIALRSGDVLRGDLPLVGMPSTSDMVRAGVATDHPGPFEFFLLAVPYRLIGPAGMVITIGAVNAGAIFGAVGIAWRRGGRSLAALTAVLALALCATLGPTIIRDPLNSHAGLLPFLWLALLSWDLALGRLASAPWAVVVATWCAQAHVVFLPVIALLGLGVAALTWREVRRTAAPTPARRPMLTALALGLVLWLPPLADQVAGDGNLGHMADLGGDAGQGVAFASRTLLRTFGAPPSFLRTDSWPLLALEGPRPGDLLVAIATLALAIWVAASAWRRGDHPVIRLLQIVGLIVAATFATLVRTPVGGAVLAADPLHLLWPVTGVVWLAVAWGAWRAWSASRAGATHPVLVRALAGVGLVAVLLTCSTTATRTRTFGGFGEGLMDPIASLQDPTLEAIRGYGRIEVAASGWTARLYARGAILASLERAGVPTQTPERDRASRRFSDGRPAGARVWVLSGATLPRQPAPDARLVAKADLRSSGERGRQRARRARLRDLLDEAETVVLQDGPRIRLRDLSREYFRWDDPPTSGRASIPAEWLSADAYIDLFRAGMIASPVADGDLVDALFEDSVGRYFVSRDEVVAVYVLPGPG